MRILKSLLWLASLIGCAVVGYGLSKFIVLNPDIRGGFLYMSPLLAMGVVAIFGPWKNLRDDCRRGDMPSAKLRERIALMADKLGVKTPEVIVEAHDETTIPAAITFTCDHLCVYLKQWNNLSPGEQDFAIAHRLLDSSLNSKVNDWAIRILSGMACSTLACVNLWLILPLHSANLLLTIWRGHSFMRRRTIELDRRAVEVTGDLESAKKLIQRCNHRDWFISRDERIRLLNEVFG